MYGSLSASSPHVVEPDCLAGSRVWSDLLLQRSNRSEYFHGRYAWIHGASSRPHPSRFLHLEHTSSGGSSAPRATCIPTIPASHGEGLLTESHYRQAGSGAEGYGVTGSKATGFNVAGPNIAGSSDGTTLAPATPILWESASRWCNHQVSLRGGESPSTPPLINLWPWVVKTLMVTGGKELEAEMITPGLPVPPREHVKGPPLG